MKGQFLLEIASGPDGCLWFTEDRDKIGRITTTGSITEFDIGAFAGGGIAVGPDGNLWFPVGRHTIGRFTL